MGWAVGYLDGRDIGYGVPAWCDHPDCTEKIDRGLGYACGGGLGDDGCGLFFCPDHGGGSLCERCEAFHASGAEDYMNPFDPKPDHPEWLTHKLTDPSWQRWRDDNPQKVTLLRASLT